MAISKIAKLTLASGENILRGGVLDAAAGFLYFFCDIVTGKVVKIRLSDFTKVATLTFAAGEDKPRFGAIDSINGFLYVSCYRVPGRIVKIRLSDFTAVATLTFPAGYDNPWGLIVDPSAGYLYAFCTVATYNVVRISLDSFTVQDYIDVAAAANPTWESARHDKASGLAYCIVYDPTGIAKINLAAFNYVGVVAPAAVSYSVAAALDLTNGYYFTVYDGAPSKVSRVILSSFLSDAYITLVAGENFAQSICANPAGKLLYAFCNLLPGKVVRIDIATFTRKDVYAMPADDNYPLCAVIDESTKNIYVGTNTSPGQVMKLYDGDIVAPAGIQHLPLMKIG